MKPLIFAVLFLGSAPFAGAHAFLDHAEPKVGGVVSVSPAAVKIWFTQDVRAKSGRVAVFDEKGNEIDRKDSHRDAENASLLVVTLPKLPAGEYKVVWEAVCLHGHHTEGKFTFEVKER